MILNQLALQAGQGGPSAATEDDLTSARMLCQMVVRQFYDDPQTIVVDIMSQYSVLPALDLAKSLGLSVKELAEIAAPLIKDRLISTGKDDHTKTSSPQIFYILDIKTFLDVTKWKVVKMWSRLQSQGVDMRRGGMLRCPDCGSCNDALDAIMIPSKEGGFTMHCNDPGCTAELIEEDFENNISDSLSRIRRSNEQLAPIMELMRKTDNILWPA